MGTSTNAVKAVYSRDGEWQMLSETLDYGKQHYHSEIPRLSCLNKYLIVSLQDEEDQHLSDEDIAAEADTFMFEGEMGE